MVRLDERKQQILAAIIEDYIATAEPVGSRTIARKHKLGVSPATIRNEMADLEESGYIEQPHTSAGRIPSHRGYRYYVNYLMKREKLLPDEEKLIQESYKAKVKDVSQVIQRTGQLLSRLTTCAAMVMLPKSGVSYIKYIQLIPFQQNRAIVVLVMDTGVVQHRLIEIPDSISKSDLETISFVLNAKLQGISVENIKLVLLKEIYLEILKHKKVLGMIVEVIWESLAGYASKDKIYFSGVFNILKHPEFRNIERVKTLLSLLEQEKLLCNLLTESTGEEGVTVHIGEENIQKEVKDFSVVTSSYSVGGMAKGVIGVLGPTRMDYAKTVSVIELMTKTLSQALEEIFYG